MRRSAAPLPDVTETREFPSPPPLGPRFVRLEAQGPKSTLGMQALQRARMVRVLEPVGRIHRPIWAFEMQRSTQLASSGDRPL